MNHGLAMLSSVLKQHGHMVELIDLRRLPGWEHLRQRIIQDEADAYGLTMMSVDRDDVIRVAGIIREEKPKSKIIVGGPHPSICPEDLEPLSCFDHVVQGEGEVSFPELLRMMESGEVKDKLISQEKTEELDHLPFADRELFDAQEKPILPFLEPPFVTLIAGRGCRYNCNYCQPAERKIFGHRVRRRSVENVLRELTLLDRKYAYKSFMIHDDCLTEEPEWVLEFCDKLLRKKLAQPFVIQSRADLICKYPEMMLKLKQAGLQMVLIGFESGSDRMLQYLRKGCTREKNIQAARICHDLGIKIWANYMLGLPTETKEEVMETYSMVQEIKPYHCSPAFYTPHPGSDLFEMGKKMGIHLISNHKSYRRNQFDTKIKGPDYRFLVEILYKSIALGEDTKVGPLDLKSPKSLFRGLFRLLRRTAMAKTPHLYFSIRKLARMVLANVR